MSAARRRRGEPENPEPKSGERIAKRLARAGLCSRREAERWIEAGRVAVDGVTLKTPAVTVTASSAITVDGKALPAPEKSRLWRYHKPRGVAGAAPNLPGELPRVVPVASLDPGAEGLMLLTNDGGLKRHLELPATHWLRRYRCRVFGAVDEAKLAALAKTMKIEAKLERRTGANAWLMVVLAEGKNKELRRALEKLGLRVNRMIRIAFGPFQLGNLPAGAVAELPGKVIREQLGERLAPATKRRH
jgi:23S rRNA pseudouridine2605 synthase